MFRLLCYLYVFACWSDLIARHLLLVAQGCSLHNLSAYVHTNLLFIHAPLCLFESSTYLDMYIYQESLLLDPYLK